MRGLRLRAPRLALLLSRQKLSRYKSRHPALRSARPLLVSVAPDAPTRLDERKRRAASSPERSRAFALESSSRDLGPERPHTNRAPERCSRALAPVRGRGGGGTRETARDGRRWPWWIQPVDTTAWWAVQCAPGTGEFFFVWAALVAVSGAILVWAAHRGLLGDKAAQMAVLVDFVIGWTAVVAYYFTSSGISTNFAALALARSDASASRVRDVLLVFAPWSNRLNKQLSRGDPYVANLSSGPAESAGGDRDCGGDCGGGGGGGGDCGCDCDGVGGGDDGGVDDGGADADSFANQRLYVEALLPLFIYEVVAEAVELRLWQPPETVRMWRRWFSAPLMRGGARATWECFASDEPLRYFQQNIFASDGPHEPPPAARRLSRDFLQILGIQLPLLLLAIYAWLAVLRWRGELSTGEALALATSWLGGIFASFVILLLGYDYAAARAEINIQLTEEENESLVASALVEFPHSVWATRQLYPAYARLQRVRAPASQGASDAEIAYNSWKVTRVFDSVASRLDVRALYAGEYRELQSILAESILYNGEWAQRRVDYTPAAAAVVDAALPPIHDELLVAWRAYLASIPALRAAAAVAAAADAAAADAADAADAEGEAASETGARRDATRRRDTLNPHS